jgi:transposase
MSEELEDLKRRLVVGRKRDGRSVYDEAAKAQLVALCLQPGVSVSRLARECGVNANQVSRWLREQGRCLRPKERAPEMPPSEPFVAVPVVQARSAPVAVRDYEAEPAVSMQVRLPNGVVVDLRGLGASGAGEMIAVLGGVRCFASTNG